MCIWKKKLRSLNECRKTLRYGSLVLILIYCFEASSLRAQFDRGGAQTYEASHKHSFLAEIPLRTWGDADFALGATYRYSLNGQKFLGLFRTFYGRAYRKNVLVKVRPHFFYQVKEYRYIIAGGVDKKFWLHDRWDAFVGGGMGYTFADHRGAAKIDTKNGLSPVITGGLAYKFTRYVFMRMGFQYVDMRTIDGGRIYLAVGGQF